jgi:hypothetical protein
VFTPMNRLPQEIGLREELCYISLQGVRTWARNPQENLT